jgi:GTP cyclohydrolase I
MCAIGVEEPGAETQRPTPQVDRDSIEASVRQIIEAVGEDPDREGLRDTPARVARMWDELRAGEPFKFTTFENPGYDQMVVVKDISFYSLCEHHILPFFGVAHVAYIPDKRIIGLSKIARLVQQKASGLQIQERLTCEIAEELQRLLDPVGVGVVIEAEHMCMTMRGARAQGTRTITSQVLGVIREKPEARFEFLALAGLTGRVAL